MILRYGTYTHPLAEVRIVIAKEAIPDEAGRKKATRVRWDIRGMLQKDTPALLTTAIQDLEAAYNVEGQDAIFFLVDGATESAHTLKSAQTVGGVRVVRPPSYPDGEGGQYSTFRTFELTLEADFPDTTIGLLFFSEVVSFRGGGPRYVLIETAVGPPQKQLVSEQTVFQATQQGIAVGHFAWPIPPSPLWPGAYLQSESDVSHKTPRRTGPTGQSVLTEWEVTWNYQFADGGPLNGTPHLWLF